MRYPGESPSRSRRDLEAARHLASGGFFGQSVSRAYYAAFLAAEDALLALGEARSKHSGVIAAFGLRVVRDEGFDRETSRLLASLFDRRLQADYTPREISAEDAHNSIRDAERFVDAVQAWLESRSS